MPHLADMFLEFSFAFTHEAVREWEARFALLIADQLRVTWKGQAGRSRYVDERSIKVAGAWCCLSPTIDRDGNLVDCCLSKTLDMSGATRLFQQAVETVGHTPERVAPDGHDWYPRPIREIRARTGCTGTVHSSTISLSKNIAVVSSAIPSCVALGRGCCLALPSSLQ